MRVLDGAMSRDSLLFLSFPSFLYLSVSFYFLTVPRQAKLSQWDRRREGHDVRQDLTVHSTSFPSLFSKTGLGESRDSLSLREKENTMPEDLTAWEWCTRESYSSLISVLSFVSSWTRLQEEPSAGKRNERQKGKVTERSEGRDEWVYERLRLVGSLSRPWCRLGRREKEETQPTLSFPILWTKIMDGEWRVAQAFLRL